MRAAAPELLHAFLERAASRWPDACAIDAPPGAGRPQRATLTYAELDGRADALAARLALWVSGPAIVAILLERTSPDIYVAMLGVMKAGAAYVCLDPAFPDEQMRRVLTDAAPAALIVSAQTAGRLAALADVAPEIIDTASPMPAAPPTAPPWLTPESLAYIIYTSGTTGIPKGVMISHRSIANLVESDIPEFGLGPGDRAGQSSSASYDSSVEEIWLALASGASLVIMDDDTARLGPDLIPWLRNERITAFCPPPTLLRTTGCTDPGVDLPDLRLLYVGGEALPRDVADLWSTGTRLVNGYGPTECSVTALRCDVRPGEPVTIGAPIPGNRAWVLDPDLNELPDGTPGELCVGGAGLAVGYRNRPEITAERFPIHPSFGRIYRTGDLAVRAADGLFHYMGRLDAQVKLRGYRIELEAIEATLAALPGVLEAAVCVQGEPGAEALAACVVPSDPAAPPVPADLAAGVARALPAYMVPARWGTVDALPRTIGGKVKRADLPILPVGPIAADRPHIAPTTPMETRIAESVRAVLGPGAAPSTTDDFFHDLGGTSLLAARLVSLLRADPATAGIAVRDVYESRTIAALAANCAESASAEAAAPAPEPSTRPIREPVVATVVQGLWLAGELMIAGPILYLAFFRLLPLLTNSLDVIPFLLLGPPMALLLAAASAALAIGMAALAKRAIIGRYRPGREPVWGGYYLRHWMVRRFTRLIPWGLLAGTEFQCMALRALGARIGKRVHIHRGVDLNEGGWDLLEIGDDACIGQEAGLRMVDLDDGALLMGTVRIGAGAVLETRAGVGPGASLGAAARLTALSWLPPGASVPDGERWDGVPAAPAGRAPAPPAPDTPNRGMSPVVFGAALVLSQFVIWCVLALPYDLCAVAAVRLMNLNPSRFWAAVSGATHDPPMLGGIVVSLTLTLPVVVALEALLVRALGRHAPGVIGLRSGAWLRVWLKTGLLDSACHWLSGALFWPWWLRAAGMRVGPDCEVSTIIDVTPELVEIGGASFLADGIYLGGPELHAGCVRLLSVRLSPGTFIGNHAVIRAGQELPGDILIGVSTPADDARIKPGTSWFGHPSFELPRREVLECDRSLTHEPPPIRVVNRYIWEAARFGLPAVTTLAGLAWSSGLSAAEVSMKPSLLLLVAAPIITAAAPAGLAALAVVAKWLLLGRVRPGSHPLWSCWCSRWDYLYMAWGEWARPALSALEGTLFLTWCLRATGMRIGRRVALGPGFSQVVDPDMIQIDDGATVSAMYQAHTFEDRVLKIDHVVVRRGATLGHAVVPLYGADVGEHARVKPHSVIMKSERLLPGVDYAGAPTRPRGRRAP